MNKYHKFHKNTLKIEKNNIKYYEKEMGEFMKKKWEYYDIDENMVENIMKKHNISRLIAQVLVNRGIVEEKEIQVFLNPTRNDFTDPFLMKDMDKATERIIEAINKKEKIIIYGDYDVDGITSITVLKKFLEERGIEVDSYIPNRLEEGYGLNKEAIKQISDNKYTLMITVDCGISGIEEVELANKLGIETIITDHHEQADILPNAYCIIDPKKKDDTYPFRGLAGVGVVFKLIQAISIKLELDEKEYLKYLDIVCVGTISDIVPLVDENRTIATLGLKLIKQTRNIGLKELIIASGNKEINSTTISFGIAPRINASGRMGKQMEALELFLTKDISEAKKITHKLNEYNLERQETEKRIYDEVIELINKENMLEKNTIVLGSKNWHHGVIGIVASKITEKFFKPTILICFEDEIGKGSGRSVPGFDLHGALSKCTDVLEKYGGHEMAIGLTVSEEQFEAFGDKFEQIAEYENIKEIQPVIKIDSQLTVKDMDKKSIEQIKLLEPFGEQNKQPIFIYKNLKIDSIRTLSEGKHLKLNLKDGNFTLNAIGFNLGDLADEFLMGDKVDVVGTLEINKFNGIETIQMNLRDIMKSIKT